MKQITFVDGKIHGGGEPCIPADDLGLQRGYAVFDYARCCNGKVFHILDHLARFRRSAAGLRLELALSDAEITDHAMTLVQEMKIDDVGLRFILTGGSAHAKPLLEKPRFIMIAEELPGYPAELHENGVKLATYEFQRDLSLVKTTNYMNAFRLEPFKQQSGAFDILYLSNGRVLECPRDNFFIFRDDVLVTAGDNVLQGITRKIVIDLARSDFEVDERDVTVDELGLAAEAFMTSTTKSVLPVVHIDDRHVGGGNVGERTRRIMARFEDYMDRY